MKLPLVTTLAIGLMSVACGGSGQKTSDPPGRQLQGGGQGPDVNPNPPEADACAGIDLPPCPQACGDPLGEMAGQACGTEGDKCGNDIGDGCSCSGGKWQCYPHAPLPTGGCTLVCR